MEIRSSYEILMERLQKEQKMTVLSADESFILLSELNDKMAIGEAGIKQKELEAKQELSSLKFDQYKNSFLRQMNIIVQY